MNDTPQQPQTQPHTQPQTSEPHRPDDPTKPPPQEIQPSPQEVPAKPQHDVPQTDRERAGNGGN